MFHIQILKYFSYYSSFHGFGNIVYSSFIDFSRVSRVVLLLFSLLDCNLILPLGICFLEFVASVLSIVVYLILFYFLLIQFLSLTKFLDFLILVILNNV